MKETDIKNLEHLLQEDRLDEAKKALDNLLKTDLTDEERGALLVNFGLLYADVMGRAGQDYLDALEGTQAVLKDLAKKEKEVVDGIDLARVENQIKNL